jgi:DNA-binding beta-propeller fold protein YncE
MRCLPIVKSVVNSETKNYILSAKITSMTALGSLKVYGANITYNGSKVDSINQTTMAKINYAPKPIKTEIQYVSQFGKFGRENGQFWSPEGITTDKSQNIYISDELDGSIQKFDSQGKFLMKFASL